MAGPLSVFETKRADAVLQRVGESDGAALLRHHGTDALVESFSI